MPLKAQAELSIEEIEEINLRSYHIKNEYPDSAKLLAREAWKASENISYPEGKARALSRLGGAHRVNNPPDSALKYFQHSLAFRLKEGLESRGIAIMYLQIGYLFMKKDLYEQAISNLEEGLKIADEINQVPLLSDIQRSLVEAYKKLSERKLRAKDEPSALIDKQRALSYGKASLYNTSKEKQPEKYANSCVQIFSIYRLGGNVDSTLFYIDQAIDIYDSLYKVTNNPSYLNELANSYSRKGRTYDDSQQFIEGISFHNKAVDINRTVADTLSLFASLINTGDNYLKQKKYINALKALEEASKISPDESADKELLRALNRNLAEVHDSLGNTKKAIIFLNKSLELNKAIYIESSNAQIQDAKENIRLEAKIEQTSREKEFQTRLNYWLIFGALVVTTLLSIILYNSNQKRKFQKIIIENQEATHMNKLLSQLEEAEQQILADQSAKQQMLLMAIGKELHDSIGSMLSAAKREMENLRNSLTDIPVKAENQFDHSYGMVDKAIRDLRKISKSPDKLSLDEQLVPSLRELCKNINRIDNSPNIVLNTYRLEGVKLPAKHELHIFRIIQEAITNIIKHAQASEVHMQLDWANRILSITIEDNGKGFDPKKIKHGVGLDSMRSRTEELNGTFTLDTAPDKGSTLFMEIPIPG